jgi:type IV pilus assembly protein PilV
LLARNHYSRLQHGSSLIEVLVSMIILAIGILGIGALQTASLKSNQSSYLRTQAVFHSLDLVERMQGNQTGVRAGNYDDPVPELTSACLTQAGCSAAEMAAHDVAEWAASIASRLPLGAATVCVDSDPSDGTAAAPACDGLGAVYAITVWWDDKRDGVANQKYVMSFQP